MILEMVSLFKTSPVPYSQSTPSTPLTVNDQSLQELRIEGKSRILRFQMYSHNEIAM
jgi:hypothetical protein